MSKRTDVWPTRKVSYETYEIHILTKIHNIILLFYFILSLFDNTYFRVNRVKPVLMVQQKPAEFNDGTGSTLTRKATAELTDWFANVSQPSLGYLSCKEVDARSKQINKQISMDVGLRMKGSDFVYLNLSHDNVKICVLPRRS